MSDNIEKFLNKFNIKMTSYRKELLDKMNKLQKEGKSVYFLGNGRTSGYRAFRQLISNMDKEKNQEVKED